MDGWNTTFLLGWPIFRGYVSFREGIDKSEICRFFWGVGVVFFKKKSPTKINMGGKKLTSKKPKMQKNNHQVIQFVTCSSPHPLFGGHHSDHLKGSLNHQYGNFSQNFWIPWKFDGLRLSIWTFWFAFFAFFLGRFRRHLQFPYHPCMVYLPTFGWFLW